MIFSYPWLIGFALFDNHNILKSLLDSARQENIWIVNMSLSIFFCYDMISHKYSNQKLNNRNYNMQIYKPLFLGVLAMVVSCFLFFATLKEVTINPIFKSNDALYFLWITLLALFLIMKYSGFKYLYLETNENIEKIMFNADIEENINNLPTIN